MINRRVVISGIGVIAATGHNRNLFWEQVSQGRPAFSSFDELVARPLAFSHGAVVQSFRPQESISSRRLVFLDRFAQFALIAAREAVAEAHIDWTDRLRQRTGVITGSCVGGQSSQDEGFLAVYANGAKRVHPFTIPRVMPNAGASSIAMDFGLGGPSFTLSTACASSAMAIGQAYWMVRQGIMDLAIAGGSEAPFSFGYLKAWEALHIVDPETCRPFSKDRRGIVLGEGGAMLVLEPMDSALARGAFIYAEVVGFGMSSDANHITKPTVAGPANAMRAAMDDAMMSPDRVDYINAHGTGTILNDPIETKAIKAVFGSYADTLPVSSSKSMHGHTLGAAGAMEAAATIMAIYRGVIPPTANHRLPDPDCDLDIVPNQPRQMKIRSALSNSFAFGGLNAVLAFARYPS